jgi:hypothetical protein
MTMADRDQYEMLRSDWSPNYHITHCPDRSPPFRAAPRDDPAAVLEADSPQQLREMIRRHHAARAGTTPPSSQ